MSTPTTNNIDKDSESRLPKQTNVPPLAFVLFGVATLLAAYMAIISNLDSIINNYEVRVRELERDQDNLSLDNYAEYEQESDRIFRQINDIRLRQSYYHAHKDLVTYLGVPTSLLPALPPFIANFRRVPNPFIISCLLLASTFFLMIGLMLDFYYVTEKIGFDYISDYP